MMANTGLNIILASLDTVNTSANTSAAGSDGRSPNSPETLAFDELIAQSFGNHESDKPIQEQLLTVQLEEPIPHEKVPITDISLNISGFLFGSDNPLDPSFFANLPSYQELWKTLKLASEEPESEAEFATHSFTTIAAWARHFVSSIERVPVSAEVGQKTTPPFPRLPGSEVDKTPLIGGDGKPIVFTGVQTLPLTGKDLPQALSDHITAESLRLKKLEHSPNIAGSELKASHTNSSELTGNETVKPAVPVSTLSPSRTDLLGQLNPAVQQLLYRPQSSQQSNGLPSFNFVVQKNIEQTHIRLRPNVVVHTTELKNGAHEITSLLSQPIDSETDKTPQIERNGKQILPSSTQTLLHTVKDLPQTLSDPIVAAPRRFNIPQHPAAIAVSRLKAQNTNSSAPAGSEAPRSAVPMSTPTPPRTELLWQVDPTTQQLHPPSENSQKSSVLPSSNAATRENTNQTQIQLRAAVVPQSAELKNMQQPVPFNQSDDHPAPPQPGLNSIPALERVASLKQPLFTPNLQLQNTVNQALSKARQLRLSQTPWLESNPGSPISIPGSNIQQPTLPAAPATAPLDPSLPLTMDQPGWEQGLSHRLAQMFQHTVQQAALKLSPAHLGPLEIQLSLYQDQASVVFFSSDTGVREAIEGALPRLRDLLESYGVRLDQASVSDRAPDRQHHNSKNQVASSHSGIAATTDDPGVTESQPVARRLGAVDHYV